MTGEQVDNYRYWRSLGYCALQAYTATFPRRRLEVDLIHFPDPRRNGRRHWQRTAEWARAVESAATFNAHKGK